MVVDGDEHGGDAGEAGRLMAVDCFQGFVDLEPFHQDDGGCQVDGGQ